MSITACRRGNSFKTLDMICGSFPTSAHPTGAAWCPLPSSLGSQSRVQRYSLIDVDATNEKKVVSREGSQ